MKSKAKRQLENLRQCQGSCSSFHDCISRIGNKCRVKGGTKIPRFNSKAVLQVQIERSQS